jgi:hypothetical protein
MHNARLPSEENQIEIRKRKTAHDFYDAVRNLDSAYVRYLSGDPSAYKVAAVHLRALLCISHKKRDISLVPRIFEEFALDPLLCFKTPAEIASNPPIPSTGGKKVIFRIPGMVDTSAGGTRPPKLFDESGNRKELSLAEWLDLPLFNDDISIRTLIRAVADKEGAHSDLEYGPELTQMRNVHLMGRYVYEPILMSISEYIVRILKPTAIGLESVIKQWNEREHGGGMKQNGVGK